MKVSELVTLLELKLHCGAGGLQREIRGAYASDLLSDVMGFAKEGEIWITLQTHRNVMAIASLKDLAAVILVKNFTPDQEMAEAGDQENIPVLSSSLTTYELCGKIYNLLHK